MLEPASATLFLSGSWPGDILCKVFLLKELETQETQSRLKNCRNFNFLLVMGDGRRTCCCGEWDIEKGNLTIGIYEVLIGSFVFLMQLMVDFIWKKDSDDDAAEIQEQKEQQQQLEEAEMILPGLTQSKRK